MIYRETFLLSVYDRVRHQNVFELLTYQKAKTHVKHDLWRNTIKLRKNKYFKGFQTVTYENAKMYAKYLILRNEKTLQEKCIISVFKLFRYQNAKRHK